MTIKTSTGLRNGILGSACVKDQLDGGFVDIYAGAVPATADDSVGAAVKLCRISVNSTGTGINFDTGASAGVIVKDPGEVWSGVNLASGTASFYRHVAAADDATLSTTAPRIQGNIGVSGADMNLSSTTLTASATQTIDNYAFASPTL
jgi:hypothetical protein